MGYKSWSNQELIDAVKVSYTKTDVLKLLNLSINSSGNYQTINRYIKYLKIDISHFKQIKFASLKKESEIKAILIENSTYSSTVNLKRKLLKYNLLINECYICKINEWLGKKIVLQLDHINGIRSDNRLENLRLLCPNCHSQTDTFCIGTKNIKSKNKCLDCFIIISNKATRCKSCFVCSKIGTKQKIIWPDLIELKLMVSTLGYVGTGRKLGVNDNSVRKRIKSRSNE